MWTIHMSLMAHLMACMSSDALHKWKVALMLFEIHSAPVLDDDLHSSNNHHHDDNSDSHNDELWQ